MKVNAQTVITSFLLTHLIAIAALLIFSWLRCLSSTRRFYSPKRFDVHQGVKPTRLPSGYIQWLYHLLRIPEDEIITVAGLDAAVYIRILRMSWEIFVCIGIWCLAVVLPTNVSGGDVRALMAAKNAPLVPASVQASGGLTLMQEPLTGPMAPPIVPHCNDCYAVDARPLKFDVTDFDKCSMININAGSGKLWVHIVSVYVVTFLVLLFMWKYNMELTLLRILFLANAPKGGPSHTVLVQDIPGIKYGTLPWTVKAVLHGTLFRFLPESWRDKMVEVVDDMVFKGVEHVWDRAKSAARKATRQQGSAEPTPSDTSTFQNFSYTHHARKVTARKAEVQAGSETADGKQPVKGNASMSAASRRRVGHVFSFMFSASARRPPAATESKTSQAEISEGTALSEAEDGEEANTGPRVPFFVRAYADKLNLDLDPPEVDKVNVANVKSRSLNVWAIAIDYLSKEPEPGEEPPTLPGMVEAEFRYVYGDAVASVNPVWDQSDLDPLIDEFEKVRTRLEDYLDWAAIRIRRHQRLKVEWINIIPLAYGSWGSKNYGVKPVKVEALKFWSDRLQHLQDEIDQARAQAKGRSLTPSAFVTFNSRVAQVVASSTLHQHIESLWHIMPAPEAKEVLWGNVKMRTWERTARLLASWGVYFLLLCFYMVPVTAIQGMIAVPNLTSVNALGTPVMVALLQSIAPGLVLKMFMLLLPYVFDVMCRYAGFISETMVDFGVVHRFFIFQVIALFLGSLVSGSFLSQIEEIIKNPSAILKTMATSVPQTATFFLNYILVAGLGIYSFNFLRLIQLTVFFLRSRIVSTPRQRARLWAERMITYGRNLPDNTMIFLFGLVFCIINPIICLAIVSYFSFILVYERYDTIYVHTRKYESGGRVWNIVFHQMMAALYIMQVALLFVILIKGFILGALIGPCIGMTATFHLVCTAVFSRPWNTLSLHDASYLDYQDRMSRGNGCEVLTEAEKEAIREMFMSPAFKTSSRDISDLLVEAEKVQRLTAGETFDSILKDFLERGLIQGVETGTDGDQPERQAVAAAPASGEHPARAKEPEKQAAPASPAVAEPPIKGKPALSRHQQQRQVCYGDDVGSGRGMATAKAAAAAPPLVQPAVVTASPETALALVSALVEQVGAMDDISRQQFQALLQPHAAAGAVGGGGGGGGGAAPSGKRTSSGAGAASKPKTAAR